MNYLELISGEDTPDSETTQEYDKNDRNDKTSEPRPGCVHPLTLPESQALGRCMRCQSEAEFVETLAQLRLRRERTHAAVTARVEQLRMGQE